LSRGGNAPFGQALKGREVLTIWKARKRNEVEFA
jgi:hypothetical protein